MKYTHHKKIIKYHLVVDLQRDLNQLLSWQEALKEQHAYYNQDEIPLQEDLADNYYTQKLIFNDFYYDFGQTLASIQKRLNILKNSEAIKPMPILS